MKINNDHFANRHIGPDKVAVDKMLESLGLSNIDELIDKTIPHSIRMQKPIDLPQGITELAYSNNIRNIASKNKLFKSFIGLGYYGTFLPPVIQRHIFENPGWYTPYTPYQAEISQGRLEALLNFQTLITELTGMDIANASLLDEGTSAAEAMIMLYRARSKDMLIKNANKFFVDSDIFPQSLAVIKTRAGALGIEIEEGSFSDFSSGIEYFGALVQYPAGNGNIPDYNSFAETCHNNNIPIIAIADILSLVILKSPASWGADVVVGSTQRFGIPVSFGGPHAAYFAAKEKYKRHFPGRIIGVSIDKEGRPALRMALQTREQHIKREKATSNICTSQVLLAIMAGMYAVYHGYEGLKAISGKIHKMAGSLSTMLTELGYTQENNNFFDTLKIMLPDSTRLERIRSLALERNINFRYDKDFVGISLDETTTDVDIKKILEIFSIVAGRYAGQYVVAEREIFFDTEFLRNDKILVTDVFQKYRSETGLMRYIKKLERKDLSLADTMIPLGSCTMKLNASAGMLPVTWPEFSNIHPFVPVDQAEGYYQLIHELGRYLKKITGFTGISFQPNSGAAGEYAGLMVIRAFHASRNQAHRNLVLIPSSAHGTNPASAIMAGFKVVIVDCDEKGNVDINDLELKVNAHKDHLAAFMVTYPSTHGVFEPAIKEMTEMIHEFGGQVYMDGANMNAQLGLTNPALAGADICHLNLHKTFSIPHGGGGPGVGPILVADHLIEFLPTHPLAETGGIKGISAVSSAPFGSAGILVISHAFCCLMGGEGLTMAGKIAILNANYMASRLSSMYPVLYSGLNGFVAHEMILDCRQFKTSAQINETDIAKRLIDFGFHAPTLSFPVHGTLMVEPTESEPLEEMDRFIEAMRIIYEEIQEVIKTGETTDNVLKNAPHTQSMIIRDNWAHSYTRQKAAFPFNNLENFKFWPSVSRIDDAYGDRNLNCSCIATDS